MSTKINLNIYQTRGMLKRVWIRPHVQVGCLDQIFDNRNMFYLCQGAQLDKEKEAGVAGLYPNCFIVALEPEEKSKIPYWLMQTSNIDSIPDDMIVSSNPENIMEICRLRDLKMIKLDYKMIYHNLKRSDKYLTEKSTPSDFPSLNLDYEPLSSPNDQALPVNW